jgi:two-component system response regulator PilR (NtrC family)
VRELENILERALTLSLDGKIRVQDIRLRIIARTDDEPTAVPQSPNATSRLLPNQVLALGSQLEGVEREAILRALEQHRYNKTAAAKSLGMTFRALRYRIKKLGID